MNAIREHVESLLVRLADCPATREEVAAASAPVAEGQEGVSASWVSKFACGVLDNPRLRSLEALDRALIRIESQRRAAT